MMGDQPWWANQGHQRALTKRKAQIAKSRKSWSIFGCIVLVWGMLWIVGASYYIYKRSSKSKTKSLRGVAPDGHLTFHGVAFIGPTDGFIDKCLDNCKAFGTLEDSLDACAKNNDCAGVTYVPWEEHGSQYELRKGIVQDGKVVQRTPDGQVSFVRKDTLDKLVDQIGATGTLGDKEDEVVTGEKARPTPTIQIDVPVVTDGPVYFEETDDTYQVKIWQPPGISLDDVESIDKIGTFINGEPTIFIGIASYRDQMCHETIERALKWAVHPDRVFFGVVEQNDPSDMPCFKTEKPCNEDPSQLLCKHRNQMRIHKVHAKKARGPTYGRHRADSLYRGEYYALQVDAHMYFIDKWDQDLIAQHNETQNDYAVLSTYPTNFEAATFVENTATSLVKTTPTLCNSKFIDPNQMQRHDSAVEFSPPKFLGKSPILQVWWAAGVSFSRGHRIIKVPYDCCLPMMFSGEECSMAYRMWTHGYDFYTFHHSAVFHPYDRKGAKAPPVFWENEANDRKGREKDLDMSEKRLRVIYGLKPNGDYFKKDIERYGLGKREDRAFDKFLKLFGIDFARGKIANNCQNSMNGNIHAALTPYIREDKKGLNYTNIEGRMNFFKAAKRAKRGLAEYASLNVRF